jgi:hypothetical protein
MGGAGVDRRRPNFRDEDATLVRDSMSAQWGAMACLGAARLLALASLKRIHARIPPYSLAIGQADGAFR